MNKKIMFAFVFALLLVALFANTVVGAAPGKDAIATLTVDQSSYAADQEVVVHVTISNPNNHTIKVLKWYTPVDDVEGPLFSVTRDGEPVGYLGAIYKRPLPNGNDYVSLKAGESITSDVPLSVYYDLSASGNYAVTFDVASEYLYSEKGTVTKKNETLTSNKVDLWADGRQAPAAPELVTPLAVTGATSYNKCTTAQQSDLVSARAQASTYSANALGYLNAGTTGLRYTTWFGTVTSSRYSTVKTHFTNISSKMDTAAVTFDCGCKKSAYAYVYPTRPYVIYLCKAFWTAPMTGTDSKAGTLIHEMSHFNTVASTNDYVYGQSGAKSLAISNPDNAINNADNHEYFAENTPAQP